MRSSALLIVAMTLSITALGAPASAAERIDGRQLLEQCEKLGEGPANHYYAGTCAGYIMGVIDSHNGAVGTEKMSEPYFCVPDEVSRGELIDIALKYVEEHPERRHFGGATLIWMALVFEYPCVDWRRPW